MVGGPTMAKRRIMASLDLLARVTSARTTASLSSSRLMLSRAKTVRSMIRHSVHHSAEKSIMTGRSLALAAAIASPSAESLVTTWNWRKASSSDVASVSRPAQSSGRSGRSEPIATPATTTAP